jgi:hypothetical protein
VGGSTRFAAAAAAMPGAAPCELQRLDGNLAQHVLSCVPLESCKSLSLSCRALCDLVGVVQYSTHTHDSRHGPSTSSCICRCAAHAAVDCGSMVAALPLAGWRTCQLTGRTSECITSALWVGASRSVCCSCRRSSCCEAHAVAQAWQTAVIPIVCCVCVMETRLCRQPAGLVV